jgi:hypothetical protein
MLDLSSHSLVPKSLPSLLVKQAILGATSPRQSTRFTSVLFFSMYLVPLSSAFLSPPTIPSCSVPVTTPTLHPLSLPSTMPTSKHCHTSSTPVFCHLLGRLPRPICIHPLGLSLVSRLLATLPRSSLVLAKSVVLPISP